MIAVSGEQILRSPKKVMPRKISSSLKPNNNITREININSCRLLKPRKPGESGFTIATMTVNSVIKKIGGSKNFIPPELTV